MTLLRGELFVVQFAHPAPLESQTCLPGLNEQRLESPRDTHPQSAPESLAPCRRQSPAEITSREAFAATIQYARRHRCRRLLTERRNRKRRIGSTLSLHRRRRQTLEL